MKCDILVIGAGPSGLWAAKTAAELGLDVVILEEHLAVGLPKSCSGWLMGCEFTRRLLPQLKYGMPRRAVSRLVVMDPVSRQVLEEVEDTGWGGYLLRRDVIDRELARLAVQSGAKLFVNVRADDLIKEDGFVKGVRTSSRRLPEVRASVTICADGKNSATERGFARREVALADECETYAGTLVELVRVAGVKPGGVEIYETDIPGARRRSFWPQPGLTITTFSSLDEYYDARAKKADLFSEKLATSFPVYVSAFQSRKTMGFLYRRMAEDGAVFVGDASGGAGIIHGMISGYYGALVAKRAIEEGDTSLSVLGEYEKILKGSDIARNPFCYRNIRDYYGSWRNWLERSQHISVDAKA